MHNQPQAVKLAIHWDSQGPVGTAARLLQETPDLTSVTIQTFKIAVNAVSKADIVSELPSPMVKQAIAYIEGMAQLVEVDGKDPATSMPMVADPATWADGITGTALSHRLGIKCDLEADPSSVPKDKAWDVCKRTKDFLKGHCHASQPKWFAKWFAERFAGVEPPMGTSVIPPAAVQVGQMVRLNGKGKNGKIEDLAIVQQVFSKHCWVLFVNDKGVKTGGRKRVMTDKLKIEPTPVPVLDPVIASESSAAAAAETDADTEGQAAQEAEAAAKQAAEAAKAEVAWEDCANVV